MTDEPLNEQAKTITEKGKITYSRYGFRSAQKSQSQPASIDGYLNNVYSKFLEEQKLDEKGLIDKIYNLNIELQQEKTKKHDANAEISSHRSLKEDKEKQIEELELEKISIIGGDGEIGDTTSFVIGAFITLLLTLYLFVFYSSSGYYVFNDFKKDTYSIINPNVFSDALNAGGGMVALIIFFPIIFLGLGFLIHNLMETNKKLEADNMPKKYMLILFLLVLTLLTDAFIGYKITKGVHLNEFNSGLRNDIWGNSMIFKEPTFWLILLLGFLVYVIWGLLLNYVLSHSYLKTESEKVKLMIENVSNRIADKRKELSDIVSRIYRFESDIMTYENQIQQKTKDINDYERGAMPINLASLKGSVGEFMGGWQNYTHSNFDKEEAHSLVEDAIKAQNTWLTNKTENFNSDNQ